MSEDKTILLTVRVADLPLASISSVKGECGKCHQPVWVSHASMQDLEGKEFDILCQRCYRSCSFILKGEVTLIAGKHTRHTLQERGISQEQIDDLVAELEDMPGRERW